MKIGYFVPEFPSQTHAFFWREIRAMEQAGHDVMIVSSRRPPADSCPHGFNEEARARTHYVFPPRRGFDLLVTHPGRVGKALKYIANLDETPWRKRALLLSLVFSAADLVANCRQAGVGHVHFHSFANSAHLGALAHILGGVSYSLTLHGDLPVYGRDHAAKAANAAFCVGVTEPLLEQLRGVYAGPLHRIPMGVDVDRFSGKVPTHPKNGALLAVTVARLTWTKGHRFFLQAMQQVVGEGFDIRYQIVGSGSHREEIENEIAALGLKDRVDLLGQLSEDEVLTLLQHADLLALTSVGKGEAAPVAVMEAMACGLPVICSRIGGTSAMIEDGSDGFLVEQGNVDEIAMALRRVASESETRNRISIAARKTAVKKFSHITSAERLLKTIEAETH